MKRVLVKGLWLNLFHSSTINYPVCEPIFAHLPLKLKYIQYVSNAKVNTIYFNTMYLSSSPLFIPLTHLNTTIRLSCNVCLSEELKLSSFDPSLHGKYLSPWLIIPKQAYLSRISIPKQKELSNYLNPQLMRLCQFEGIDLQEREWGQVPILATLHQQSHHLPHSGSLACARHSTDVPVRGLAHIHQKTPVGTATEILQYLANSKKFYLTIIRILDY